MHERNGPSMKSWPLCMNVPGPHRKIGRSASSQCGHIHLLVPVHESSKASWKSWPLWMITPGPQLNSSPLCVSALEPHPIPNPCARAHLAPM